MEQLSIEQLQQIIFDRKYPKPENFYNRRHLIRTIERNGKEGSKSSLRSGTKIIGLLPNNEQLRRDINQRARAIFEQDVLGETERLISQYGEASILSTGGIVYKICVQLLKREISEQRALDLFQIADWQYSRRQITWFKRSPDIKWFENKKDAFLYLQKLLNT